MILDRRRRRWRSAIPADKGGGRVLIAERQAVGNDSFGLDAHEFLAHLAPCLRACWRIQCNLRMGRLGTLIGVTDIGVADIADADGTSLRFVAIEKPRATPTGKHR